MVGRKSMQWYLIDTPQPSSVAKSIRNLRYSWSGKKSTVKVPGNTLDSSQYRRLREMKNLPNVCGLCHYTMEPRDRYSWSFQSETMRHQKERLIRRTTLYRTHFRNKMLKKFCRPNYKNNPTPEARISNPFLKRLRTKNFCIWNSHRACSNTWVILFERSSRNSGGSETSKNWFHIDIQRAKKKSVFIPKRFSQYPERNVPLKGLLWYSNDCERPCLNFDMMVWKLQKYCRKSSTIIAANSTWIFMRFFLLHNVALGVFYYSKWMVNGEIMVDGYIFGSVCVCGHGLFGVFSCQVGYGYGGGVVMYCVLQILV